MFWRQELPWLTDLLLRYILDVAALNEHKMHINETGMRPTTRPSHPGSVVHCRPCVRKVGEVRKDGLGCLLLLILDNLKFCKHAVGGVSL